MIALPVSVAQWTQAVRSGEPARVRAAAGATPSLLETPAVFELGQGTPERALHWALDRQRWALARVLLDLGADPNAPGAAPLNHTPVEAWLASYLLKRQHWSTATDNPTLEALLAAGANPNRGAHDGAPPPLAVCIAHRDRRGRAAAHPIALRLWEAGKELPCPVAAQWFVWHAVLTHGNAAWVDRLELAGWSPAVWDSTQDESLPALVVRGSPNDPARWARACSVLVRHGLEWRSPLVDHPAHALWAAAREARLNDALAEASPAPARARL